MFLRGKPTRRRVLVVEDDWAVREVLKLMLEDEGYDVSTAKQGKDAIKVAQARPFDLVLTDVSMPGVSGIDVARTLREGSKTAGTLLAIHTGLDEHWVRERFADYDLFLTKAADTHVLVEKIARLFEEPSARREARDPARDAAQFTPVDVVRVRQALQESMGVAEPAMSLPTLLAALGKEIDQLRRLGKTDAELAQAIGDALGSEVAPSALRQ